MVLTESFYTRTDVVQIARELLGKKLVTLFEGKLTSGIITETEAYAGPIDRASHAYAGRRTARTEVMFSHGGVAYVYLCYGIHHLFNVVTNEKDTPHAILIRAIEPVDGIDAMLERRKKNKLTPILTSGPGALSEALGISTRHTGFSLQGPEISIQYGLEIHDNDITSATRIGVAYAMEDAFLPYRFYLRGNMYVSKGKGL